MASPSTQAGADPPRDRLARALAGLRDDPGPLLAAAAVVAALAYGDHVSRLYHRNVVDDSLISMQYAKNFALGRGVVFNVGERVEGYTNFLWVAFMAPLYLVSHLLGANFLPFAIASSVLFAAADVFLVYLIGRQIWGPSLLPALLALGLVVVDSAYGMWAAMALEGHFLIFWVLLAVWASGERGLRRRWLWVGAALAGVHMTRPDGALLAVAFGASEGVEALKALLRGEGEAGERRARAIALAKEAALALGAWAALYGAYFAWRYSYYGYPFPNTYYLKVSGSKFDAWQRGVGYVKGFFEERANAPALAALGLLAVAHPTARLLALYAGMHLAYIAYVGGDFYPGHRFLLVLVPVFALLAGAGLDVALRYLRQRPEAAESLATPQSRTVAGLAAAAVIGLLLRHEFTTSYRDGPIKGEVKRWGGERNQNRSFMYWLGAHKRPGSSISTGDIGSAGFFSDFERVIDMLGVIDPVVAHQDVPSLGRGQAGHEKWATPQYIIAKKPTYIKLGYMREDFSRHGYYLMGDMPLELGIDGIWALDELAERGRYDEKLAFHFDPRATVDWKVEGDAFADWPAAGRHRQGQGHITGHSGAFVNSYHAERGDRATGRAVSPPFTVAVDKIVLRVGGGHDPERLRVSLVVDGRRAFSATGRNSETLTRSVWDVAPLRGQTATLEIVDEQTGGWGHLLVDEIIGWTEGK
ncbi:MAG TPA: hypothetical protein VFS00_06525 [Polyangiaceae bacterium]|nr:hypothetical protein [Polyangiaceae bacterium]